MTTPLYLLLSHQERHFANITDGHVAQAQLTVHQLESKHGVTHFCDALIYEISPKGRVTVFTPSCPPDCTCKGVAK